jgi:RNA polymerase sigma-70 factor (ECF subfamily)
MAYLYNKSYADDLYQEIMMQVWKSLDSYRGDAKLNTWVYRIAVNTAITYNVKQSRAGHTPLPETIDLPADDIHANEKEGQLAMLHKAISQLEENDRLIISLVLEDVSYREIAEITGNTENNIGVKVSRIKTRLMKLMTKIEAYDI